ncbi:MAG: hypothetical protein V7765_14240 [Oleispira sp.]
MIRNLLASAILIAASTAAFAGDISDSLNVEGAVSSVVISAALAKCPDSACEADVIIEAIEADIDATSVMSMALAAGIDTDTISSALRTAKVSESDIVAAAIVNNQNPENFTDATATGNTTTRTNTSTRNRIPAASVPDGISPAVGEQRAVVTDFDIPGISIGNDNSIQFD